MITGIGVACLGWLGFRTAVQAAPPAGDEAGLRAAAAAYREALARDDVAAIRKAWTADGDIVDGWGNLLPAAEASAATGTAAPGPRPEFRVGETRLRFITPDVALEDGSVDVILPGTRIPLGGWFTAVWVRQDGAWKLAGVREAERPVVPDGDMLEDLDWMVGDWVLVPEGDDGKAAAAIEMSVRWDAGRRFLIREATLKGTDDPEEPGFELQQRIGWDPLVGRIRSWSFSTDGSRAEATWFRDGDSWIAKGTSVLPDGTQASSVNVYSYDGKDRCVWRTVREPLASGDGLPARATWIRKPGSGGQ